jgi:hypothetical protein
MEKTTEFGTSNWLRQLSAAPRFRRNTALLAVAAALLSLQAIWAAQPQLGDVLWSYDFVPNTSFSTWCPTVAPDGTVYIGTAIAGLFAITNDGTTASAKWVLTNIGGATAPALATDGTIYVYAGLTLYALNPDGSQKWSTNWGNGDTIAAPAIGRDNTIYLAHDGYLYAFSPAGTEKWQTPCTNSGDYLTPALALDGTIYIAGISATSIWAIAPDGTPKWNFPLVSPDTWSSAAESVAIGGDGTLYCAAFPFSLYAISPAGGNLWLGTSGVLFRGSAAVGRGGTIYVGDAQGLNAFDPSGALKWHTVLASYWHSPPRSAVPAIDANGIIYYCDSNHVFALSPAGVMQWSSGLDYNNITFPVISPVLGPNGTLYTCSGNKLYAIYYGSTPADAPWPTDRQNARHTGKVEKPWLQQPVRRNDGTVTFQLYGQLGEPLTIQGSTDLSTWMPITNVFATAVPMDFVDTTATNFPIRFYRASSP